MQSIQNNYSITKQTSMNAASQPNVGDVIPVTVKERASEKEAIVSIKGTVSSVTFEGKVPDQDKVFVEVTGKTSDGQYTVKVTDRPFPTPTNGQTRIDNHSPIFQAVKAFTDRGMPITREQVSLIQNFMKNEKGTSEQKLETLRMMAQKQIVISDRTLRSVHEAMNGKPLAESLTAVLEEVDMPIRIKNQADLSAGKSISQVRAEVQREPDLAKVIEKVEQFIKNQVLSDSVKTSLERSVFEAKQLLQAGQGIYARAKLIQNFITLEKQASIQPNVTITEDANLYTQRSVAEVEASHAKRQNPISGYTEESIASLLNSTSKTIVAESVRNLLNDIQKEPSFVKVLDKASTIISEHSQDPEMNFLKAARDQASQLYDHGRELAARRELTEAVTKMNIDISSQSNAKTDQVLQPSEQYVINEAIQTLNMNSKNLIVTEITEKLSQLTIDFKKMKQDVTKNLNNISSMIESRQIPLANIKQTLQSTIHQLDHVILKSDALLYTDMETEKKLLLASGQLAEARKLLDKGEVFQANQLVKEVKSGIEAIIFKPSDVKVKHFVSGQFGDDLHVPVKQMSHLMEQTLQPNQDASSRQIYEMVRKLGLTHEHDAAFSLISKSGLPEEGQLNENIKATLLKMMQSEEPGSQLQQKLDQAMNNITGQQLLNKQDSSGTQNLFFQLPFLLNKQVENVKIYINSRKNGEKVDWENCSLYFVMETKKLGEMGVLVTSAEKKISLTLKSNKDLIAEKVTSLTEITEERFSEIGYHLNSIGVKPLSSNEPTTVKEEHKGRTTPTFTEKGYDYSI